MPKKTKVTMFASVSPAKETPTSEGRYFVTIRSQQAIAVWDGQKFVHPADGITLRPTSWLKEVAIRAASTPRRPAYYID